MKIKLISFGKIKNDELSLLADYYRKLCTKYLKLDVIELKGIKERQIIMGDVVQYMNKDLNVFLSEEGKEYSSKEFSERLLHWRNNSIGVNFFIANAFGFAPEVKNKAEIMFSLSKMTFPHEMSKVMLLEQIFRAGDIMFGGKYHK